MAIFDPSLPMLQQSMFSSEELPASPSPSPASEVDWMMSGVTSRSSFVDWLIGSAPAGSFGRMCLEFCPPIEDVISGPSSGRWRNSGMASPGGVWTLSTSEFPSDVVESFLSDVLEVGELPPRYYLSPTACAGIVRRAAKRGKRLPGPLELALRAVIEQTQ